MNSFIMFIDSINFMTLDLCHSMIVEKEVVEVEAVQNVSGLDLLSSMSWQLFL